MGSLFYINVPTRKYEVTLRQREHNIEVVVEKDDVAKVALTGNMASGQMLANAVKRQSLNSTQLEATMNGENVSTIATSGSLVDLKRPNSTVDVYEATVDGKKANIVVSKDSMAIYPEGESEPVPEGGRRKSTSASTREAAIENIISNTYLEKHLEDCLQKFVIYDATWGTSVDGNFSQISFTVAADRSEEIINKMFTLGIGAKYESTLSVCSAIVYYNQHQDERKKKAKELVGDVSEEDDKKKDSFGSKFVASIKSRLTVAQVVQTVQNNAVVTFDYIVLIVVAAIIAGLGLLENSSVNLVASMLISPLMGPIMAGCFGAVIRDVKLVKIGVISELIGISLCFLVGFVFGAAVAWHPFDGPWAKIERWPTSEMVARSQLRGMVVGAFVAIPSGAGVALSILAGNAGSLVGVAISASLLPPAVNAGLLWGVAAVHSIHDTNNLHFPCNDSQIGAVTDEHVKLHEYIYCPGNLAKEFGLMGICSFGLTVVNIVLILMVGAIVLKIKEVAPHTTRKTMNRFWKEDLKAMREYNKVHGSFNKQEIYNELHQIDNSEEVRDELRNDRVFAQVTQRNLFGTAANILDTTASDAAGGEEGNAQPDAEAGGGEGLWSKWFGKKAETTSTEVETEMEDGKSRMFRSSNRPHLEKTSATSVKRAKTTKKVNK